MEQALKGAGHLWNKPSKELDIYGNIYQKTSFILMSRRWDDGLELPDVAQQITRDGGNAVGDGSGLASGVKEEQEPGLKLKHQEPTSLLI